VLVITLMALCAVTTAALAFTMRLRARSEEERVRLEDLLASKAEELARASEELGEFASAVSHDLAEPVIVMRRYAEILKESSGDVLDADSQRFLDAILRGGEKMQAQIDGLLSVARVGGATEPDGVVQADEAAEHVLESLKPRRIRVPAGGVGG
jgi:light-regulated signal transduction histidine kinase (bacteriophytochrome)